MPEVFLGLGSNVRPERALRAAAAALAAEFGDVRWSAVYSSAAQGVAAAGYLNAVATFATGRSPAELRATLRHIEEACGRRRGDPATVALDIDLLLYGQRVDGAERLPRPRAFADAFVVVPLAELAPALVHPVLGTTAAAAARGVPAGAVMRIGRVAELA